MESVHLIDSSGTHLLFENRKNQAARKIRKNKVWLLSETVLRGRPQNRRYTIRNQILCLSRRPVLRGCHSFLSLSGCTMHDGADDAAKRCVELVAV